MSSRSLKQLVDKVNFVGAGVISRLTLFFNGVSTGCSWHSITQHSQVIDELDYRLFSELNESADIASIVSEFEVLYKSLVESFPLNAPTAWNGNYKFLKMLFLIVRVTNAKKIVETGVANGLSTNTVLRALELNGSQGKLVSMDINPNCKNVAAPSLAWDFINLNEKHPRSSVLTSCGNFENVDIWIHDSDHSKYWQSFEYKFAISKLSKKGLLVSDDIDSSTAWIELVSEGNYASYCMFDGNRSIGILQKGLK